MTKRPLLFSFPTMLAMTAVAALVITSSMQLAYGATPPATATAAAAEKIAPALAPTSAPISVFKPAKAPQLVQAFMRDNLTARLPGIGKIDEVQTTPVAGLYEVRVGKQILYADAKAEYFFMGSIVDGRTQLNLTKERVAKLMAVDFAKMPAKDSIKIVKGDGSRKIAIFADPNCGYCKKLEADLQGLKNVTMQIYLYPVLGEDSIEKSRNIWCSKDPAKTWTDWMVNSKPIPVVKNSKCDLGALTRNAAYGQSLGVNGTPAIVFEDGVLNAGYMTADALNKRMMEKFKP